MNNGYFGRMTYGMPVGNAWQYQMQYRQPLYGYGNSYGSLFASNSCGYGCNQSYGRYGHNRNINTMEQVVISGALLSMLGSVLGVTKNDNQQPVQLQMQQQFPTVFPSMEEFMYRQQEMMRFQQPNIVNTPYGPAIAVPYSPQGGQVMNTPQGINSPAAQSNAEGGSVVVNTPAPSPVVRPAPAPIVTPIVKWPEQRPVAEEEPADKKTETAVRTENTENNKETDSLQKVENKEESEPEKTEPENQENKTKWPDSYKKLAKFASGREANGLKEGVDGLEDKLAPEETELEKAERRYDETKDALAGDKKEINDPNYFIARAIIDGINISDKKTPNDYKELAKWQKVIDKAEKQVDEADAGRAMVVSRYIAANADYSAKRAVKIGTLAAKLSSEVKGISKKKAGETAEEIIDNNPGISEEDAILQAKALASHKKNLFTRLTPFFVH